MDAAISAAAGEVAPCVKGADVMLLPKKYEDNKKEDELALVDPKLKAAVSVDKKNEDDELALVHPKLKAAVSVDKKNEDDELALVHPNLNAAVSVDKKNEDDELALVHPNLKAAVSVDKKNEDEELALVHPNLKAALNIKETKPAIMFKEMPAVSYPEKPSSVNIALGLGLEETMVTGWNEGSGETIRRDQTLSQDAKAEKAAAKKGLGYLCYGSHGALKSKFQ